MFNWTQLKYYLTFSSFDRQVSIFQVYKTSYKTSFFLHNTFSRAKARPSSFLQDRRTLWLELTVIWNTKTFYWYDCLQSRLQGLNCESSTAMYSFTASVVSVSTFINSSSHHISLLYSVEEGRLWSNRAGWASVGLFLYNTEPSPLREWHFLVGRKSKYW